MTPLEMEKALLHLLDREEICDVVTNYCRGVDRFDRDLLMTVFHDDALIDQGVFVGDKHDFWNFAHGMHSTHHHVTQHYVANHSCQIDGDVAHAETYFFYAALNKRGAPFSMIGGRYLDRLEKREGKWAIAERLTLGGWAAPAINQAEAAQTPEGGPNRLNLKPWQLEAASVQVKGSRDGDDPSYVRPLTISAERVRQYDQIRAKGGDGA
jgi:hypothetical protein